MSWTQYTDHLLSTGKLDKAAIFSASGTTPPSGGNSLWAESGSFTIANDEIEKIDAGFSDSSTLQARGIHIEGAKYFLLRADERSIYGKQSDHGIICVRTNSAIIIAHYPSGVQAQEATAVVENMVDYLITHGY